MRETLWNSALSSTRAEELAVLRQEVIGEVLVPGQPRYADECRQYNLLAALEPEVVVSAARAADVAAAVRFAGARGLPVAVKNSGHQVVSSARGAVLVTTRQMKGISIDVARRRARVAAGVIWQEVIDEAARHGLAPLSGSAPDVGVTGYTLGGGQSPVLGRSLGYAADHVHSLDVVTADGQLRTVTAESEPDLFWALRGCKGNFGVVTALEFELFPVTRFYGGSLYFAGAHLAEILHAWRVWVTGLPVEATSSIAVQRLPVLPELPEPLRGANVVHLRYAHLGSEQDAERLLAPMRAVEPAVLDAMSELPYTASRRIHNDPEDPMPYWDRTTSLREFSAEAVEAFVGVLGPESGSQLVNVEIRYLGGAFDREPAVANSVSTRGVPFVVFGFGVGGPDQAELMRGSLAAVIDALAPWSAERRMANFLSRDEATSPAEMEKVFGTERYARLVEIKKAHDPANVFRLNHNIPAA
ncbi:FAD-binding protein [Amycolatopsis carbonis]|uniref:FAD-binding protein n=1 Tax=Amycolatopsis carbonis TaxID=715471 RepID=A0A9Y2INJ6_9PSEU|nr:FAD-binding protein [Amycolatopsis sp. 2-15]WIX83630.1 FAD-binding protein [Amycolatopsis sp. 2-15]